MKNVVIFLLIMLFSISGEGQKINNSVIFQKIDKNGQWLKVNNSLVPEQLSKYKSEFGLGELDELVLVKKETDKLGFIHYRYQQYHKGIKVEGAEAIVHAKENEVKKINHKLVAGIKTTYPHITKDKAIAISLKDANAIEYMWESQENEEELKKIKQDNNATYYPQPELVYYNPAYSNQSKDYILTWKLIIYSKKPFARTLYYIDASNGNIIRKLNMLQTTDVTATAVTKYNGTQQIIVEYTGNLYRLRESTHGNGIHTYNMNNQMNYFAATDITDTDTFFTSDPVANNAHWATIKTYEYYFQKHNRNSYDNNGAILASYVHFGQDFANAFWDGSRMTYGDGVGGYSAFTTLDICGHEITHGVTEYSANLVYEFEPGALNEAFSDIFATSIEFFADDNPNWLVGEDVGQPFRSMSNPKAYEQPNTYKGQYWHTDPNDDNGGVHVNSGVANYWYYLLCEGGSGVNDNGHSYNITGIGMNKAEQIAYRMLTVYLTSTSQYSDAYFASLMAAEDLYGYCSEEVKTCADAWYAVGVGYPINNDKVYILSIDSPTTACGLNQEYISIKLFFNGCDTILLPGTLIPVAYSHNGGPMVLDTIVLNQSLDGRDTITFTFSQPVDVSQLGIHKITCWAKLGTSSVNFNDSITYTFENLLQQNFDFGINKILSPTSNCMLGNEYIKIKVSFHGCDSIPAGTVIALAYQVDNNPLVEEQFTLDQTMYPGDQKEFTFSIPADFSTIGYHNISVYNKYSPDTLTYNNSITNHKIVNPYQLSNHTLTFSESNIDLFMIQDKGKYANIFFNFAAANGPGKGMNMTGGNAMLYYNELEIVMDTSEVWNHNEIISAKAHFCIDARGWTQGGKLMFDLKQTHGGQLYSQYIGGNIDDFRIASNFRVLINGNQISRTFNPNTPNSDPFKTYVFDLSNYQGQIFTITLESRNISKDTSISIMSFKMDNAYVDNLKIINSTSDIDEEKIITNSFQFYPNPAQNRLAIEFAMFEEKNCQLYITDITGKTIYEDNFSSNKGQNLLNIDLKNFEKGIYLLHFVTDKVSINEKFVKL